MPSLSQLRAVVQRTAQSLPQLGSTRAASVEGSLRGHLFRGRAQYWPFLVSPLYCLFTSWFHLNCPFVVWLTWLCYVDSLPGWFSQDLGLAGGQGSCPNQARFSNPLPITACAGKGPGGLGTRVKLLPTPPRNEGQGPLGLVAALSSVGSGSCSFPPNCGCGLGSWRHVPCGNPEPSSNHRPGCAHPKLSSVQSALQQDCPEPRHCYSSLGGPQ